MATRKKNLITIGVAEQAPKHFIVTATFKDAPPIVIDSKNPRQALMQIALQAAIYLVMREQGKDTRAHTPLPKEFKAVLKSLP